MRNLKPKSKIYKASDRDGMYVTVSPIRLALRMILLTLVRKSELIHATWDGIDFENATWTIPKQQMAEGFQPLVR